MWRLHPYFQHCTYCLLTWYEFIVAWNRVDIHVAMWNLFFRSEHGLDKVETEISHFTVKHILPILHAIVRKITFQCTVIYRFFFTVYRIFCILLFTTGMWRKKLCITLANKIELFWRIWRKYSFWDNSGTLSAKTIISFLVWLAFLRFFDFFKNHTFSTKIMIFCKIFKINS